MIQEWEPQEIHLTNFIFGEARLFRLPLPEGWTLKRGFSHPELHATHWRKGVNWVASAYLHYLLCGPALRRNATSCWNSSAGRRKR